MRMLAHDHLKVGQNILEVFPQPAATGDFVVFPPQILLDVAAEKDFIALKEIAREPTLICEDICLWSKDGC